MSISGLLVECLKLRFHRNYPEQFVPGTFLYPRPVAVCVSIAVQSREDIGKWVWWCRTAHYFPSSSEFRVNKAWTLLLLHWSYFLNSIADDNNYCTHRNRLLKMAVDIKCGVKSTNQNADLTQATPTKSSWTLKKVLPCQQGLSEGEFLKNIYF